MPIYDRFFQEGLTAMADEIKTMDARIFRDELMGLAND